jgi:hypothetical protein
MSLISIGRDVTALNLKLKCRTRQWKCIQILCEPRTNTHGIWKREPHEVRDIDGVSSAKFVQLYRSVCDRKELRVAERVLRRVENEYAWS